MIGVVVPAHNEAGLLTRCLNSLARAATHPELRGEVVRVVVVLDACTDLTSVVARRHGAFTIRLDVRNVGTARAAGASLLLQAGAWWMAFTDADTEVSPDWLVAQIALGADAVCGTVSVSDWSLHPEWLRNRYEESYVDADGHRHIHGANFGVCASAYRRTGGFLPLAAHEDVHLVHALEHTGARIAWSAVPRVTTSARIHCRARDGFGEYLRKLAFITTSGSRASAPRPVDR